MRIFVTGGAGFIGSHTVIELIKAGHGVVVADNLSNSSAKALKRAEEIIEAETGRRVAVPFYETDIRDRAGLDRIFDAQGPFDCCIHFAGLKAVGESVGKPWEYYDNNIHGTLVLLSALRAHGCKNIIFSSSATVYGDPATVPITEDCPKGTCTNPYGWTKWMIEQILTDLHTADVRNKDPQPWNAVLLRYFNPIGAHPSGKIGEDPDGIPNNLMPYITQVAVGKLPYLNIYGGDYETPDGTGVRDYIHVVDLARGHVAALRAVERNCGVEVFNLGTGRGNSVLELVRAFEHSNGLTVPYRIGPRRAGDIAACWSDPSKALEKLGWQAEYGIAEMCRDSWNWQKNNPDGYE